ncbi:hypothetical protein [Bdellovibrio sp. HCB2-146]|uniref:hypothetical protein n=1 Tax=Bdellovibrio sp. HCB2-146 TaxID=3394362 RepID=UPI0039BD3DEA
MSIGQLDLIQNYHEHPAFQNERGSSKLDTEELEKFETAYVAIRNFGNMLTEREFLKLAEKCHSGINNIFNSFKEQARDSYEQLFWSELGTKVARLLIKEMQCYRKHNNKHKISFGSLDNLHLASQLKENRYFFGSLGKSTTKKINEIGSQNLNFFRENVKRGMLTREDLSVNSDRSIREMIDLLNYDFDRCGINAAVSAYMGKDMVVAGVAHELSIPQSKWWESTFSGLPRPPKTLYAHVDESIANPKAIVYLSDVSMENGPTSCYPGLYENLKLGFLQQLIGRVVLTVGLEKESALKNYYTRSYHQSISSESFRQHFMLIPPEIRFNSHLGWDILPNSKIESAMVSREVFLTGSAGRFIVFDGARLFHRGGLIESGDRVALQVIFDEKPQLLRTIKSKIKKVIKND